MQRPNAGAVIAFSVLAGGCATEASQLAWSGPGAGPCLFGGVTERAVDHCAQINFGVEGLLIAINDRTRARFSDGESTKHVAALQRELAPHRDLRTEPIYTCGAASGGPGECHASLLVTKRDGERFVLDNGAVVNDTVGAGGVASFAAFEEAVGGVILAGRPPKSGEDGAAMRRAPGELFR